MITLLGGLTLYLIFLATGLLTVFVVAIIKEILGS